MAAGGLPAVTNLSKKAIEKAVLKTALAKPLSLYASVIGVLGCAAAVSFDSVVALAVGVAGLVLGIGSWVVNYFFRYDTFARAYLERLREARLAHIAQKPVQLKERLAGLGFPQGAEQVAKLEEKFAHLKQVLDGKFTRHELTYGRYLAVAEQVFLASLDNLQQVADHLHGIQTIDPDYIQNRLQELGHSGGAAVEIASLRQRLGLRETMLERARQMAADNETAMTTLDLTTVRLAGIQTTREEASMDMETAMRELTELANRAKAYDRRT